MVNSKPGGVAQAVVPAVLPGGVWAAGVGVPAIWVAAPGQTYDRLVLRSEGSSDNWLCRDVPRCAEEAVYVRDQLVRELHGAMGQSGGPGALGGALPERGVLGAVQSDRAR